MKAFRDFLASDGVALTEGSVFERLRRDPRIQFDPELAHASLVYDDHGRNALETVHREYIEVAVEQGLPMVVLTDTWRANKERIGRSKFRSERVNQDNASFLCSVRDSVQSLQPVFVGGLSGCKGDAYKPAEALTSEDAYRFHLPQMEALAESKVDFLFASTLPAVSEAEGIGRAMASTGLPFVLSFVVRADGAVLDGRPLAEAIDHIDSCLESAPAGYYVNCVHPTLISSARYGMSVPRLIGMQGNTSRRPPEEIDGSAELDGQEPGEFASDMMNVVSQCGIKIAGGCCGTDTRHMAALAAKLAGSSG